MELGQSKWLYTCSKLNFYLEPFACVWWGEGVLSLDFGFAWFGVLVVKKP